MTTNDNLEHLDDPRFPLVGYRLCPAGPAPLIRGTGIRVKTIFVYVETWGMSPAEIADNYDISLAQVEDALQFAYAHRAEIEADIAEDNELERRAATPYSLDA